MFRPERDAMIDRPVLQSYASESGNMLGQLEQEPETRNMIGHKGQQPEPRDLPGWDKNKLDKEYDL